jgi:hypothetical protein
MDISPTSGIPRRVTVAAPAPHRPRRARPPQHAVNCAGRQPWLAPLSVRGGRCVPCARADRPINHLPTSAPGGRRWCHGAAGACSSAHCPCPAQRACACGPRDVVPAAAVACKGARALKRLPGSRHARAIGSSGRPGSAGLGHPAHRTWTTPTGPPCATRRDATRSKFRQPSSVK